MVPNNVTADLKEIARAVTLLIALKAVAELRVPNAGKRGTASGYYDNPTKLAADAYELSGEAPGVYILLNPARPELLSRSVNRYKPFAKVTTSDSHIVSRRWLLVDLDPKRPAGISSSDGEHEAAIDRARVIRAELRAEGWPEPILADSGNGGHLLYHIDLPNDAESRELLRCVLEVLHERYSDQLVEVDKTTFNAARISKLYGTVAAKGDSTPDRPHRLSLILDRPDNVEIVPKELLEKLASAARTESKSASRSKDRALSETVGTRQGTGFAVEDWLVTHGIPLVRGPLPIPQGGQKWIVECPNDPSHKGAAIIKGQTGALAFKCFHNSCSGMGWAAYRAHYEPDHTKTAAVNNTDVGNARRLVNRFGGVIRYVEEFRKWLRWDGKRWVFDEGLGIEWLAKQTVSEIENARHALKSEHQARIKAMVELAKSEPGVAIRSEELDRHRHLLNVLTGTVDLRTGVLLPHCRENMITALVPVNYDPDAKARQFARFLIKVLDGDRKLIRYVQRAIGYSLTGETREQVFFMLLGNGANGKSTLTNVLSRLLGDDYARTTPGEMLFDKKFEGIPNDIARLRKARFVTALEVEGRPLNEAKIKRLTGGDKVTARFMRAEWFDFEPEFKLWFAANRKPPIDGTSDAMWRRVRPIPFAIQIPENERDQTLPAKLEAELPGILAWAVKGAKEWYSLGLGMPDSVQDAITEYRREMDVVGLFIRECCEEDHDKSVAAALIYDAYVAWCKCRAEEPLNQRRFGGSLTERKFGRRRSGKNGQMYYLRIGLRAEALKELNDSQYIQASLQPEEVENKGKNLQFVQSDELGVIQTSEPEREFLV